MGAARSSSSRKSRRSGAVGRGQSAVSGSCAVGCAGGRPLARSSRVLWQMEFCLPAVPKMGKTGRLRADFTVLSEDADFEYVILDGTIVRVHQHGTGARGGDPESSHRTVSRWPESLLLNYLRPVIFKTSNMIYGSNKQPSYEIA